MTVIPVVPYKQFAHTCTVYVGLAQAGPNNTTVIIFVTVSCLHISVKICPGPCIITSDMQDIM